MKFTFRSGTDNGDHLVRINVSFVLSVSVADHKSAFVFVIGNRDAAFADIESIQLGSGFATAGAFFVFAGKIMSQGKLFVINFHIAAYGAGVGVVSLGRTGRFRFNRVAPAVFAG